MRYRGVSHVFVFLSWPLLNEVGFSDLRHFPGTLRIMSTQTHPSLLIEVRAKVFCQSAAASLCAESNCPPGEWLFHGLTSHTDRSTPVPRRSKMWPRLLSSSSPGRSRRPSMLAIIMGTPGQGGRATIVSRYFQQQSGDFCSEPPR